MANLPDPSGAATFPDVYQIETSDPVLGGPTGIANEQAKQLLERDQYLLELFQKSGGAVQSVGNGSTTLNASDVNKKVICTGNGTTTITLPEIAAPVASGAVFIFVNQKSDDALVNINRDGSDVIRNDIQSSATSFVLRQGFSLVIVSDGSGVWHIVQVNRTALFYDEDWIVVGSGGPGVPAEVYPPVSGAQPQRFRKLADGRVELEFSALLESIDAGIINPLLTLPAGYRPPHRIAFTIQCYEVGPTFYSALFSIETDGTLVATITGGFTAKDIQVELPPITFDTV